MSVGPLVSVVIPTFHRVALLEEAVRSVLAQSWPHIEILVIDDADDVQTAAMLQRLAEMVPAGKSLRVLPRAKARPDSRGAQVCRNIGIEEARGDFVLFLDDDDLLASECVSGRVLRLLAGGELDFVVGQCRLFDGVPKPADKPWMDWEDGQDDLLCLLRNRVPWQTTGPLWRAAALRKLGPWDEALAAGHDYEMHVRALSMGLHYRRLPDTDYFWRAPRPDSCSGFEKFKQLHADGALVDAFVASVRAVSQHQAWTTARQDAAADEAFRLAMQCRLFGGTAKTAGRALDAAREAGCGSTLRRLEQRACNAAWFRLAGRVPVMSWARRRGLVHAG